MKKNKIYAMIPARIGSTRLKMKNLALLNGKPLIYYAINAAKNSRVFDRVILNSDSILFNQIADRYDVEFYHRPEELGSSKTKSDEVVADFINKNTCDVVAWINPISPLQTGVLIRSIIEYFQDQELDTLFTVKDQQVHCNYKNNPVNYIFNETFALTQDLEPLQSFSYTVMMWRSKLFMESYRKNGRAFFCGNIGFYTIDKISSIIIKDKKDLMLAQSMLNTIDAYQKEQIKIQYDVLVEDANYVK